MPSIKHLRRSASEKKRQIAEHIAKTTLRSRGDLGAQEQANLTHQVEQAIEQWCETVEIEIVPPAPTNRLQELLQEHLELCEQITSAEAERAVLIKLLEDLMEQERLSHLCGTAAVSMRDKAGQHVDPGESKIVVKVNAPKLLYKELMARSWKGESIVFSGNTDCYQPLEASYKLTRACLEVCAQFRNPVSRNFSNEDVVLARIFFLPRGEQVVNRGNPGLPVERVPPVVFSETLRDVGLIATVARRDESTW